MNKLQQLMVISMEECSELTQSCSKIIRKFETVDEVTDKERAKLLEEAGDVYAMLQLMIRNKLFSYYELECRAKAKHSKLKLWSNLLDEVEPSKSAETQLSLFNM